MKNNIGIIGLAFCITLAPITALAQDAGTAGTAGSSLDGTATSPDGTLPDTSANPFTGAAGADKFYQDNSLTSTPQSNNTTTGMGATGNSVDLGSSSAGNLGSSNPAGTASMSGDSSAADTANPFAGAAGSGKFYQDNSLSGSTPATNLGSLGGMGSGATSWATTP